jgi:hypothetical protein
MNQKRYATVLREGTRLSGSTFHRRSRGISIERNSKEKKLPRTFLKKPPSSHRTYPPRFVISHICGFATKVKPLN